MLHYEMIRYQKTALSNIGAVDTYVIKIEFQTFLYIIQCDTAHEVLHINKYVHSNT